jgi:serine/threonine-protein kinase
MGWILSVVLLLTIYAFSLPSGIAGALSDPVNALPYHAPLIELGLSRDLTGWYLVLQSLLTVIVINAICIFIFHSRSDNWMVLFVTLEEVLHSVQFGLMVGYGSPVLFAVLRWLSLAATMGLLLLFPNGRFYPRWAWILLVINTLTSLVGIPSYVALTAPDHPIALLHSSSGYAMALLVFTGVGLFGIAMQVLRYRRVSTPTERQQTKWIISSMVLITVMVISLGTIRALLLQTMEPGQALTVGHLAFFFFGETFAFIASLSLPIAICLSIVRYRLWDVDLLINRSLVYGLVTISLVLIYLIVFLVLRAVLEATIGADQGVIPLAIAAGISGGLFNPLRKQAQNVIDRRLYHFRFDLNQAGQGKKKPEIRFPGSLTGRRIGAYEILDVIGRGGMGEVYKGYGHDHTVAIKILAVDLAEQNEFRARFQREARTTGALDHANIVKLLDSGESDRLLYLILEFVDGIDLGEHLQRHGPLEVDSAIALITALAAALDHAHAAGFVHRDLKPSNIMLRPDADGETWQPILMDFGIAKIADAITRYTGSGAVGTIDYMAPEQIIEAREVDHRADIYALGLLCFEMLTGERPFKGTAAQVLFAHIQQPAPDIRTLNDVIPRPIAHAIARALEKNAANRFDSAGQFAAALND